MALSVSEIKHIARLARLELEPDEEQLFADQLSRVVDYIDQIQRVEERLAASLDEGGGGEEGRGPEPPPQPERAPLDIEAFLANAPESLDRFLLVPRVK